MSKIKTITAAAKTKATNVAFHAVGRYLLPALVRSSEWFKQASIKKRAKLRVKLEALTARREALFNLALRFDGHARDFRVFQAEYKAICEGRKRRQELDSKLAQAKAAKAAVRAAVTALDAATAHHKASTKAYSAALRAADRS